jgi:hypothetical protein
VLCAVLYPPYDAIQLSLAGHPPAVIVAPRSAGGPCRGQARAASRLRPSHPQVLRRGAARLRRSAGCLHGRAHRTPRQVPR